MIETCYKRHRTVLNPIIEWSDRNVWDFIRAHGVPYCELYDCGFKRLGCVLCPMAGSRQRERETAIWPKIKGAYRKEHNKRIAENRYLYDELTKAVRAKLLMTPMRIEVPEPPKEE